jgi:hypothetical protein
MDSKSKEFQKKLTEVSVQNEGNHQELLKMIDAVIQGSQIEGDIKWANSAKEFKKTIEEDYAKLKAEYEAKKEATKKTTEIVSERTVHGNETQANAVMNILESNKIQVPSGLRDYLKHVNIASISRLLSMWEGPLVQLKSEFGSMDNATSTLVEDNGALSKKGMDTLRQVWYTADGALWSQEIRWVYNMLKFFIYANSDTKALLQKISIYYNSGLDATVLNRHLVQKDAWPERGKESAYVVARLTDTYEGSRISRTDLTTHLTAYMKNPANVKTLGAFLGVQSATPESIATAIKGDSTLIAKFYNRIQEGVLFAQTYNTSGNFDIYALDRILKGTYASINAGSLDKQQSVETQIDAKVADAMRAASSKINSDGMMTAAQKDELLKKLDAIEANPAALGAVKKEIFRLASMGALANIWKWANMAGLGANFATAIDRLTVSVWAFFGQGGKLGLGLAARYGLAEGKITESANSTTTGRLGLSAGIPAFISLDAGIAVTDKIKVFGGGGFDDQKTNDFSVVLGKGFQAIAYSRLDRREDNIREYGRRIESALSRVAFDNSDRSIQDKIIWALKSEWLESKNATQLALVATRVEEMFAAESGPISRLLLLRNLSESHTRTLLADEVANTRDGKSFGGWSLGLGHMLGVTFPMAGISFYEVDQYYSDLAAKNAKKWQKQDVVTMTTTEGTAARQAWPATLTDQKIALQILQDLKLDLNPQTVNLILLSRGTPTFNEFQSLLAGKKETTEENRSKAFKALISHLDAVIAGQVTVTNNGKKENLKEKYGTIAKELKEKLEANKDKNIDFSLLSDVNALSSGSYLSRKLGGKIGPNFAKEIWKEKSFPSFLTAMQSIASKGWWGEFFKDMYTKEKFGTFTDRTPAPNENFFGMVDYQQTLGKATGFDIMTSGFPLVGKTEATASEKNTLIDKLLVEFRDSRKEAYKKLIDSLTWHLKAIWSNMTVDQAVITLLKGWVITGLKVGDLEPQIKSSGAKVYKALSALDGATCFNSAAYMTMPEITVDAIRPGAPGQAATQPQMSTTTTQIDIPPATGTRADRYGSTYYAIGLSGFRRPEEENVPTTSTPGGDPDETPGSSVGTSSRPDNALPDVAPWATPPVQPAPAVSTANSGAAVQPGGAPPAGPNAAVWRPPAWPQPSVQPTPSPAPVQSPSTQANVSGAVAQGPGGWSGLVDRWSWIAAQTTFKPISAGEIIPAGMNAVWATNPLLRSSDQGQKEATD